MKCRCGTRFFWEGRLDKAKHRVGWESNPGEQPLPDLISVEEHQFDVVGVDEHQFTTKICGYSLRALATDATGKLDVLGEDGDALGVDGAQVGVLEETHEVRLRGLLQRHDRRGLEAQVRLEVLRNLADKALERELAEEKLRRLLVATDLTESDGARPVAMGLLHTASGGGRLARSLGGQRLAGSLASGGLTRGLLGTSHGADVGSELLASLESF
jgi:hypothetical protein